MKDGLSEAGLTLIYGNFVVFQARCSWLDIDAFVRSTVMIDDEMRNLVPAKVDQMKIER